MMNLYYEFTVRQFCKDVRMPFKNEYGQDIWLPMSVLNARDLQYVQQDTDRLVEKNYAGTNVNQDDASSREHIYDEYFCWNLLLHSLRNPDDTTKHFFPSVSALQDCLTNDQAHSLQDEYIRIQASQPWYRELDNNDPDRVDVLIGKLMESANTSAGFEFINLANSDFPHQYFNIPIEAMHDGFWFAWIAAKRYQDMLSNPEKYAKKQAFEESKKSTMNWTYEKVMILSGRSHRLPNLQLPNMSDIKAAMQGNR